VGSQGSQWVLKEEHFYDRTTLFKRWGALTRVERARLRGSRAFSAQ